MRTMAIFLPLHHLLWPPGHAVKQQIEYIVNSCVRNILIHAAKRAHMFLNRFTHCDSRPKRSNSSKPFSLCSWSCKRNLLFLSFLVYSFLSLLSIVSIFQLRSFVLIHHKHKCVSTIVLSTKKEKKNCILCKARKKNVVHNREAVAQPINVLDTH